MDAPTKPRLIARRRGGDPRQRLIDQITSCWRTQALYVAVQLELPEHMAQGPRDLRALAEACSCSSDGLQRLLRALCTLHACRELRDGRFELTAAGALLRREPPEGATSLRAMAMWWGGPMWPMWGDLAYSVRTGRSARAHQTGSSHYAFLDEHPEVASLFHETMRAMTALIAAEVAMLATWRNARELVDVGGGNGELAAAIAAAHPGLRATVVDRPDAEPGARDVFARREVAARACFVAGDFFAAIPPGADRYMLKSILHNWDDTACQRILARCAEAAPPGARLLIVERVRPGRLRPTRRNEALARTDLNMLAGLGGRERSLSEFAALLDTAGFRITGTSPTQHEFSVLEAQRY
jgi:orsellinic acid C2-O-methyltransferase